MMMGGRKEHIPLEVKDLKPCVDGQFTDSYGNVVKHGSRIVIESTYGGYSNMDKNQEALVEWDGSKGMYNYVLVNDWLKSRSNFYGIHKFRIKNEKIQTTENKTVPEVSLESKH